jgi:transcriptional regulator with XRE-family HTH domain
MYSDDDCNVYNPFVTNASMEDSPGDRWPLFGAWLKEKRTEQRYTQTEAARMAGIDRQQWYRIEAGKSGTKRETVIAIAAALSLDEEEALERAGYSSQLSVKPTNLTELISRLEKLGVDGIHFANEDALRNATPDQLQEVLDAVRFAVELTLRKQVKEFRPHEGFGERPAR